VPEVAEPPLVELAPVPELFAPELVDDVDDPVLALWVVAPELLLVGLEVVTTGVGDDVAAPVIVAGVTSIGAFTWAGVAPPDVGVAPGVLVVVAGGLPESFGELPVVGGGSVNASGAC
jgi:hypothetical protein